MDHGGLLFGQRILQRLRRAAGLRHRISRRAAQFGNLVVGWALNVGAERPAVKKVRW